MHLKALILFTLLSCWKFSSAQFIGGASDGYASSNFENSINIFSGGSQDGYEVANFSNSTNIYKGGNNDGSHFSTFSNFITIYSGGSEDGHSFTGLTNSISIFSGGMEDGHAMNQKIISFIWTGSMSPKWTFSGNWSGGFVPNINSPVIIPSNVPQFPLIDSGLMSIGENQNSGIYLCKRMEVQTGAEITLTSSAFLENYGTVEISGQAIILNTSINAIQNINNGLINIKNGGLLSIQ